MDECEVSKVKELLSSFQCGQDRDIELFLHNKAIEFEKLSKARTYLICNREELCEFSSGNLSDLTIYGYISLALKNLSIPEDTSNRMRKMLDGYSAKIHGKLIHEIPCYLIGQLSKNSNVSDNIISGEDLLRFSCDIIAESVKAVGGRFILIECKEYDKLIQFYERNYFQEISRIPDGDQGMVQMIRKVP